MLAALARALPAYPGRPSPAHEAPELRPRVYPLRPGAAVVRVASSQQRAGVAALQGLQVQGARLRTVTTSGTLRKAKAAVGVLTGPRRGRARRRASRRPG